MGRIFAWAARGIAFAALGVALVLFFARYHDGPIGAIAGGPLEAGELVAGPLDWSFVEPIREIELQLLDPPRSRTVWVVTHEGRAFVPCGFLTLPLWKQWPYQALEDGRAVARIGGKRYELAVQRIDEAGLYRAVTDRVAEKYRLPGAGAADPENTWVFELLARS